MINSKRVKRIKNLIYAFIILVLFLPLILMSILSFRMIGLAEKMSAQLDDIKASVSSQAVKSDQTAPESGYVIEPEDQSSDMLESPVVPQTQEEDEPEITDGINQSGEASGSQGSGGTGAKASGDEIIGGGNTDGTSQPGTVPLQVGGGANSASGDLDELLESDGYIAGNSTNDGETANPQTGASGVQKNYNGNPLTGR